MAFHIRDPETDALVRELARREGVGLTEAVKRAVRECLEVGTTPTPLYERLRKIVAPIASLPDTGVKTDKAFYDDLSGS